MNEVKRSDKPCAICGEENFTTSYFPCKQKTMIDRLGICFTCAHWEVAAQEGCPTVINHMVYTPGTRTTGEFRGMGGRRFDIEYFDGRKITTVDLWCGGEIPERWRDRIPNTARFAGGAKAVKVGDITCFNESFSLPEFKPE